MLSVLTFAAAFLFLQTSPTSAAKPSDKLPLSCTVSGRVVTVAEGTPLKSARVALMTEHQAREPKAYVGISGSDGRFTIKDVPAGRYRFFATHSGFVERDYQSSRDDERGAVLALHAGEEVKDVLFRLTLAAVISGRVNDEDGEPMISIQVVALHRPTEDEMEERDQFGAQRQELSVAATAQTDDRGQYRLFGLKAGEYYIKGFDNYEPRGMVDMGEWAIHRALGSQYAPVYYPGVMQLGQAQAVQLTPGEDSQVDFIMRQVKTVQLSGRVIGVDGKPATGAYAYLEEVPADYGSSESVEINPKGEFTIKGVAPGSYMLRAREHTSEEASYHASQKIEVGGDDIDSITLALGRGVNLSGRIDVAGAGEFKFERLYVGASSPQSETEGGWARVKKDGTFQWLDVPEGTFALTLYGLEEGWFVKSARRGQDDILTNGLTVEKGEHEGIIQIALSHSGAQLEGSVTQDDKPTVGARVHITPDPETAYNRSRAKSTTTDQGGRYSFMGLSPGQYQIVTKNSDSNGGVPATAAPQHLTLTEHDKKEINLKLESPIK